MERIMGLWLNKAKDGNMYLKGKFLGLSVIILPNKTKEGNQPDFNLFLAQDEPQEAVKTSYEAFFKEG